MTGLSASVAHQTDVKIFIKMKLHVNFLSVKLKTVILNVFLTLYQTSNLTEIFFF